MRNAAWTSYDYFVSNKYLKIINMMLIKLMSPAPTINGIFCVIDAWATQNPLPATDIISIYIDTSSVWRVFNALNICGTSISVQSSEAIQPNKTSNVTLNSLYRCRVKT